MSFKEHTATSHRFSSTGINRTKEKWMKQGGGGETGTKEKRKREESERERGGGCSQTVRRRLLCHYVLLFFISVFPISRVLDLAIFRSSVICFSNAVIVNTGNIDNVCCTMKIVDVEIPTRENIEIRRFGKAESADFCWY